MTVLEVIIIVLLSALILDRLGINVFRFSITLLFLLVGTIWCIFHPRKAIQAFRKVQEANAQKQEEVDQVIKDVWEGRR